MRTTTTKNLKKRTRDKENLNGNAGDEEGKKRDVNCRKKRTVVEELHTHLKRNQKLFFTKFFFFCLLINGIWSNSDEIEISNKKRDLRLQS